MPDVNRAIDSVTKLGPGHAIAVVALLMVCGAGWVIHDTLTDVRVSVVDLGHELEANTDAQNQRFSEYQRTQERWHTEIMREFERSHAALIALCYANANGKPGAREYCDDAARE